MTIPLEALLRRVSRLAEQMFNAQGDIDPIWLVENAKGKQRILVVPVIAPTPLAAADEKERIAAKMRELFAENEVVRYARATEAWMLKEPEPVMTEEQAALRYAALGYTLANHPDRREIVQISGEDATEVLFAFRDVIRPAHGKPYLGKLGPIEQMECVESRWLGLLPNTAHAAALRERPPAEAPRYVRRSRDLPDDVGTVFVTAVPNAPIQLMGRRDPKTGELCMGSAIIRPPKDAPWPPADLPPCELVTGPEAEQLILSVHRGLTEDAEAEGLTLDEYMAKHHREREP
jgi:hypothetical protein